MITQGRDKKTIVLRQGESIWHWKTTLILASLIYGGDYATGQGNNFKCREEGYQADPRDCQVYYRCVSWGSSGPLTTFKFECGPGTVFSHSKGDICVHPRDSERSECSEMGNDVNSVYQPQHRPQYSSSRPTQHYPSSSTASRPQHRPQYPTSSSPSRPQYPSSSRPTRPHHPQYPSSPSTPSRPRPQHPNTPPSRPQYTSPQYIPPSTESPHANEINPEAGPRPGSNLPSTGGQSQCQSEGFMAHPQDCKKFIRCVNDGFGSYSTYEFTCGEGTVWDPTIESCNHAWAVKSSCGSSDASPGSSHNDGNLPEPGHPSQGPNSNQPGSDSLDPESDYPSQGKEPDQNQDPGTEQDSNGSEEPSTPYESSPNVPSQGAGYPGQDSNNPEENDNPNEGSPDQESNPNEPSGDSGYPGQDPDNPNEPGEDSGYPDSRPSSPYPLYPPGPEPPSATTESLDASTVRQPLATRPPTSAASPVEPNLPESEGPEAETTNKPGAGSGSGSGSGDCNEEGFFPVPDDCHKFFRCVKAESTFTKYEFECGESTAWDPSVQTCNYEYAVSNCKNPGLSGQTTPSSAPTETSSKDEEPDSDKDQSSSPPSVESSTEEDKQSSPSSTDSSDTSDTSSDETPTTSTTSASASSNPEDTSTPSSSTEESSPSDSNETSPEPSPEENEPTFSTTKEPVESEDSKPTTENTPSTAASAGADKKPSGPGMSASSCKDEGFFSNPSDCRKFFRCVKGDNGLIKYDFDCAPGTAWEQSLLTCNYIHLVASCGSETNQVSSPEADSNKDKDKDGDKDEGKDEGKPTSESTEKPKDEGEGSSSPNSTTEASNKPTDSSNGSNKPSQVSPSGDSDPNKGIVCNSAGFYGHPIKCDKFYRCVDNGNGFNVYHFDCAPGTIFDPSLSLCNYPESVYPVRDCSGSLASPPSSSTESSEEPSTMTTVSNGEPTTESSESTDAPGTGEMTTGEAESTTAASGTESPEGEGTTTSAPAESTEEGVTGSEMTTEGSQDQTTVASTESPEQSTEMEMITESGADTTTAAAETSEPESTTPAKAEGETGFVAPCPIVGNLTDQQIVLVCPTGFRRHPKYCNMFYQCMSEGNMEIKILVLACPDKTIFDEKKIQCVEESESSQVCDTEMASARLYRQLEHTSKEPMKVKRESLCPDEGHYPFQQGCSNAFYKCKRDSRKALQGYLYKCPKEYVYWSVSRRCERQSRLSTCSHIKYEENERIHSVENRWELPIEDRNLSARMLAF
ncbi:uncharacterized protein LOC141526887 [Cotesia typhae]|uniref:uncharacterized protein LOC141526887 n=1 Tax=Cotesia typhae TaxID=2053667 RepID=UPI003D6999FB